MDRSAELKKLRLLAVKTVQDAYTYSSANSYTHEAMQAVLLLDEELKNFKIEPRREAA